MSDAREQRDKYRYRALHWALAGHGDDAAAIVARHPDADMRPIAERAPAGDEGSRLAALLWSELRHLERAVGLTEPAGASRTNPDAMQYWMRRCEVARREEWRWLLGQAPNLWRVLIDLPAAAVEELAIVLGVEIVAHIVANAPKEHRHDLLSPLDETLTHQVESRVGELQAADAQGGDEQAGALPATITDVWSKLYRRAARRRVGRKLLRWLSMSLLSSMMDERLDERLRRAGSRHCRSDLIAVLEQGARRALVDAESIEQVEAVVLDLLGRVKPVKQADGDRN